MKITNYMLQFPQKKGYFPEDWKQTRGRF